MWRPTGITLLSNLAMSGSLLFIPNLSKDLGADDVMIGVIGATFALALFVSSYIFGRESDVHDRRIYIKLGLGLSVLTFILQVLADPFFCAPLLSHPLMLACVRFLAGFTAGISPAALTAYVSDSGGSLSKFSAFSSLGAAGGVLLAGLIALYWGIFMLSSLAFLIAFLMSLRMPSSNSSPLKISFFPKALIRKNWYVYASFFLRNLGSNSIWLIFPLFIASIGGDKFWTGVIYMVNVGVQFPIMMVLGRFSNRRLLSAGLILSMISFVAFTFTQHFYELIPIQLLIAAAWSCLYVGSIVFLMEHNIEKATSAGVLNSAANLSAVFGSLLGGVVSQLFGFVATMYEAAALTLLGYVLFKVGVKRAFKEHDLRNVSHR